MNYFDVSENVVTLIFLRFSCYNSQAVKDAIVDKHNELRAKVANGKEKRGVNGRQPKASNMRKLVWNDELAEVAQRYHI